MDLSQNRDGMEIVFLAGRLFITLQKKKHTPSEETFLQKLMTGTSQIGPPKGWALGTITQGPGNCLGLVQVLKPPFFYLALSYYHYQINIGARNLSATQKK